MSDLGPITERRFAEAFAAGAVITAKAAARRSEFRALRRGWFRPAPLKPLDGAASNGQAPGP